MARASTERAACAVPGSSLAAAVDGKNCPHLPQGERASHSLRRSGHYPQERLDTETESTRFVNMAYIGDATREVLPGILDWDRVPVERGGIRIFERDARLSYVVGVQWSLRWSPRRKPAGGRAARRALR